MEFEQFTINLFYFIFLKEMAATASQRYIADHILENNNPVVRSLCDKNKRHYMLSYMYYFMLQDDFLDKCRTISHSDASSNKVLKVLKTIPQVIASADEKKPIDMTKIINSFLAVCNGKSALAVFDTIIRTELFDIHYKYSKRSNMILVRKSIKDDILRSISIPSCDLVLPQKLVFIRANSAKNKSISVPKAILMKVRGSEKLYKLEGIIHEESNKNVFKYFKNDNCLDCLDSVISQFDDEIAITNCHETWQTLFYHSVSIDDTETDCIIQLGVETPVKHDDVETIEFNNNRFKAFQFLKVATGQKLTLDDISACAPPTMSKMNKFFQNVLKVLRIDLFREMNIGELNFDMIKRDVTGKPSIVYHKSKNLKKIT